MHNESNQREIMGWPNSQLDTKSLSLVAEPGQLELVMMPF